MQFCSFREFFLSHNQGILGIIDESIGVKFNIIGFNFVSLIKNN